MRYSHQLDGLTIFQWRARAQELAEFLAMYADHTDECIRARAGHWHRPPQIEDRRVVCEDAPCTCGLLVVLGAVVPTMAWVVRCPDKPALLPVPQVMWCLYDSEVDCLQVSMRLNQPTYCNKPHRVPANL